MSYTAAEIAEAIGAQLVGDPTHRIEQVMPLETASNHDIGFAESDKYRARAEASAAGALLVIEAGGLIGDFDGGNDYLDSGNVVCGSPKAFKATLQAVKPMRE